LVPWGLSLQVSTLLLPWHLKLLADVQLTHVLLLLLLLLLPWHLSLLADDLLTHMLLLLLLLLLLPWHLPLLMKSWLAHVRLVLMWRRQSRRGANVGGEVEVARMMRGLAERMQQAVWAWWSNVGVHRMDGEEGCVAVQVVFVVTGEG